MADTSDLFANMIGNAVDPELTPVDNMPEWMSDLPPVEEWQGGGEIDPEYDPYYGEWGESIEPVTPTRIVPLQKNLIISNMNKPQADAISMPVSGAAMVLAGAGTGKTAVLTRRIAWLCASGVDPRTIMAVTFTNKAAREMKERLARLGVNPMPMMGTFHSVGLSILKLCPESAGVRAGFTVMDENDTKSLWNRIFVAKKDEVPDHFKYQLYPKNPDIAKYRGWMFSLKELGIRSSNDDMSRFDLDKSIPPSIYYMLDIYEKERCALNMVDFSDLISGSLAAISDTNKGKLLSQRFTHLLVDEFQDTSSLQYAWVKQMMDGRRNIFCVGDDSQSIYSFRGAVVKNIAIFVNEFKATEVMLEQNYRCGTEILSKANKLIANNRGGSRKKLWADSNPGDVEFREFFKEGDEANWIAEQIKRRDRADNSVVLLRTRAAMLPILIALRAGNITHHVVGAKDFFDRKEIRDAMALVSAVVNPSDYQSFKRAASIFEGVGSTTIEKIITISQEQGMSPIETCGCSNSKKVTSIWDALCGMSRMSVSSSGVANLIIRSGLAQQCEEDEDKNRVVNIREFIGLAGGFNTLGQFLEEITLFKEKSQCEDGVTVSTIHGAKGLEWEDVYLPALSQGHLPSERLSDDPAAILDDLEEERRLMYVAITRAKTALYTSFSKSRIVYGEAINTKRSNFIAESGLHAHFKPFNDFFASKTPSSSAAFRPR